MRGRRKLFTAILGALFLGTGLFAGEVNLLQQIAQQVETPKVQDDDDVTIFKPADHFQQGQHQNVIIDKTGDLILVDGQNKGTYTSPVLPAKDYNGVMFAYSGKNNNGLILLFIQCFVDGMASGWQSVQREDDLLLLGGANGFQYRIQFQRGSANGQSPSISNLSFATSNYNNGYQNPQTWTNGQTLTGGQGLNKPTVVSRAQWGARPPNGSFSTNFNPTKIVIHHTAGSKGGASTVKGIQAYHQNDCGWTDIGYHFLVNHEGTVFEGRPENVQGAHVAGANSYCLGISAMGHYSKYQCDKPCWDSIVRLTAYACSKYRIHPSNIIGHQNMANKDCPGKYIYSRMNELREAVSQLLQQNGVTD